MRSLANCSDGAIRLFYFTCFKFPSKITDFSEYLEQMFWFQLKLMQQFQAVGSRKLKVRCICYCILCMLTGFLIGSFLCCRGDGSGIIGGTVATGAAGGGNSVRLQLGMFTIFPANGVILPGGAAQVTVDMFSEASAMSEEVTSLIHSSVIRSSVFSSKDLLLSGRGVL